MKNRPSPPLPLLSLLFIALLTGCGNPNPKEEVSGEYYDWTQTLQPERPWIRDYNKTLVMKHFLCSRDSVGGVQRVYLTFSDVLEVIKKTDHFTLGLPRIVYLVGWQYNGHDSKYPAWFEVNEALKRPEDATALESLQWLIREARKYHTTISLHINMIDAFKESPLWNEYFEKDIIAKDKNGDPIPGEVFGGMQSYQISYAREWELELAQKRIDRLVGMIPELVEAGTIHVDAFHSYRPSGPGEPISPYLGYTTEDEMAAQRKIFRYWRNKGIDVTCEGGMYWLRKDPFIGLQAMTWHYREGNFLREDWLNKPEGFASLPAQLCATSPMQAELNIMKDPVNLPGLIEEFALKVVPWYFRKNADPAYYSSVIITPEEVICPVLWKERTLLAYSTLGFENRSIHLPSNWLDVKELKVSRLGLTQNDSITTLPVTDGKVLLTTGAGEAVVLGEAM